MDSSFNMRPGRSLSDAGRRVAFSLSLLILLGWCVWGCAGTGTPKTAEEQAQAAREAEERIGPTRVSWFDFEQTRKRAEAEAETGKKTRKIGIDRLVLVTPTFENGRYAQALQKGSLSRSTKVMPPDRMEELLEALEEVGFFDASSAVQAGSFERDPKVRAAVTVERQGKEPRTLVHMKGQGMDRDGRKVLEVFSQSKKLIQFAFNSTVQFGHVTIKQSAP